MAVPLDKIEEEINSEEILDNLIGNLKCIRALEIVGESKHVYKAWVPDHKEDEYIKDGFPFAIWTDDQVPHNEWPLFRVVLSLFVSCLIRIFVGLLDGNLLWLFFLGFDSFPNLVG